jgi:hypothetical protein
MHINDSSPLIPGHADSGRIGVNGHAAGSGVLSGLPAPKLLAYGRSYPSDMDGFCFAIKSSLTPPRFIALAGLDTLCILAL